jgi:uncharacterized membrane protein YsdA (DUF1294 family)
MQKVLFAYFLFINLAAFILYAYDKYKSRGATQQRVSERELHAFALLGGFLGATLSMILFSHKVSKSSFLLKHILIILIWISATFYYFFELSALNFLR